VERLAEGLEQRLGVHLRQQVEEALPAPGRLPGEGAHQRCDQLRHLPLPDGIGERSVASLDVAGLDERVGPGVRHGSAAPGR
jgi:hypothetical protein